MNELAEIISGNEDQIRAEWIKEMSSSVQRPDLISKTELEEQCRALLSALVEQPFLDWVRSAALVPETIARESNA
jgi:hypothetical protein